MEGLKRAKCVDVEREELIKNNIGLVEKIVKRIMYAMPSYAKGCFDDLMCAGLLGLAYAAHRYDPQKGNFTPFASLRIKGAVIDHLRSLDWMNRDDRRTYKKMEKVKRELRFKLKREPSLEEIAHHMQVSSEHLRKITKNFKQSYIMFVEDFNGYEEKGKITYYTYGNPISDYDRLHLRDQIVRALKKLNKRECLVICLYYLEGLSLKEIKAVMGISEARISQIHKRALLKLRAILSKE